jgi:outer membrane receptor protein involved in Fe transport
MDAELTYNRPYSENGEISVGYYGSVSWGKALSYVDTLRDGVWDKDQLRSYLNRETEQENQVFFTLQHKFGNFTIKPGVRLEHDYIAIRYPEVVPDTFGVSRHYFHVRPSLHLSYRTKSMHNFRLSYSYRSSNPGAESLTRFIEYGEDSFSSGNPYLKSILTHSLEAGWQKYWEKYGSVGVTLYFKAKTRDVTSISEPAYDDLYGRLVSYSYPVNVGKSMNTGLEFNTMYRPNAMFNMRFYANVYHSYLETMYDDKFYKDQMWSYSFNLSLWAKLWKRLEINVSGYYRSPSMSLFSTTAANYSLNAGLRCDFFDKKLSVYLNANDIFNWNKWGFNNDSPYLVSHSTYKYNSRTVALGFTLRFGKMELENQARQGAAAEGSGGGKGGM